MSTIPSSVSLIESVYPGAPESTVFTPKKDGKPQPLKTLVTKNGLAVDLEEVPLSVRLTNLGAIIIPLLALVVGIILLWGVAFNWVYLALMIGMYLVSGLGITVGYHRYYTHKSFEATPLGAYLIGAAGSMAVEGNVIEWTAAHRRHHQCSDHEGDPHSPHLEGSGVFGVIKGFIHAHMGWIIRPETPKLEKYVPDLLKDPVARVISRQFTFWVGMGLLIPAVLGGLIMGSWTGFFLGFLWGGLVRVALVHHITWSVNSVCHIWGTRPYESHDESRNNAIVGVLAFGEGWHNNHHAFPASARHGLKWWQIDTSYMVIRAMEFVGLARKVRVPTADRLEARLRRH